MLVFLVTKAKPVHKTWHKKKLDPVPQSETVCPSRSFAIYSSEINLLSFSFPLLAIAPSASNDLIP